MFKDTPFAINRVSLLMFSASSCASGSSGRLAEEGVGAEGMQTIVETAYLFVRNRIAIDVIGPEGVKYTAYLATLFFFIFFMNLMEIVPGINFPVTSRMAIPVVLALLTYLSST